jgi:putative membrane-bound dehydrogenase-like protein
MSIPIRLADRRAIALLILLSVFAPTLTLAEDDFPKPYNTEPSSSSPLPADQLVASTQLPPGFQATIFASEPDVQQPIAMSFDSCGRLWIAESYTYAERKGDSDTKLRDRIILLEDRDNDGRFDERKVFWDEGQRVSGLVVGLGGVWVLDLPRLIFIPDHNFDDKPDGPPQVILDGFDFAKARHTIASGLKFGPDGWLYGRQGILAESLIGKPGTSDSDRVVMNAAIWRVHPATHRFEVVASGTTNPWGMDWNEVGDAFFINTVIGHLWHVIPGAHYRRMFGDDPDPHVYQTIDQHADHVHWDTGEVWQDVRKLGVTEASSKTGGGHAHTGLMIYQADNWPKEYRNQLFTINFHGRRLNCDQLVPHGSGYLGKHGLDHTTFGDPWFRGIDLAAGMDGGVYVLDWSDTGECHEQDGVHRSSGRIYRITYNKKDASSIAPSAEKGAGCEGLTDAQLIELQRSSNEWLVRASRLEMQRRFLNNQDVSQLRLGLTHLHAEKGQPLLHMRAMWALHSIGGVPRELLKKSTARRDGNERAWVIRLLVDSSDGAMPDVDAIQMLHQASTGENTARIRLALASAAQKLSTSSRVEILRPLLRNAIDANDHNLPLMLWYACAPIAKSDPEGLIGLLGECEIPTVCRCIARRASEEIERQPDLVNSLLAVAASKSTSFQVDILLGIQDALGGFRKAVKPATWDKALERFQATGDKQVRQLADELSALFGDGRALNAFRIVALDESRDVKVRRAALQAIVDNQPDFLREVCEKLFEVHELSITASSGLALIDDAAVPSFMIARYTNLYGTEKSAAVAAMASRRSWTSQLLQAVSNKTIATKEITASIARQIRSYGDAELTRQLEGLVGRLGAVSENKTAMLKQWKSKLTPKALASADVKAGKAVFATSCATCHLFRGEGIAIGPDLTGAQRSNIEYLLENMIDPSAVVPPEFRMTIVLTQDGRTLSGIVKARNDKSLKLQTSTELVTLSLADIEAEKPSDRSIMPDGVIEAMQESQVRDLIAFLMVP